MGITELGEKRMYLKSQNQQREDRTEMWVVIKERFIGFRDFKNGIAENIIGYYEKSIGRGLDQIDITYRFIH